MGEKKFDGFNAIVERYRPDIGPLEELYKELHQNPELSGQEEQTAERIAHELKNLRLETVHEHVGGSGVVGVIKNGEGPVVLLRSEMDGLPIAERTKLPYASKKTMTDRHGHRKPVSHACGHDMHMACLIGAVQLLMAAEKHWSGTLICLFQPAEETFEGATAMIKDGLYDLIPKPDVLLAQHVVSDKAGTVSLRSGPVLTASDAFDIRIHGKGGHGSSPEKCLDPIITGSNIVNRLQTIVSLEVSPSDFAVVTCGSIQGGETSNIIPDYTDLKVGIRTYEAKTRRRVKDAVARIVKAECHASGLKEDPDISENHNVPPTVNDDECTQRLRRSFDAYFDQDSLEMSPDTASEDFGLLASPLKAPYVYWNFGCTDPKTWDEANKHHDLSSLPGNHSSHFAPVIEPTLRTGLDALGVAALTFLRHT